MLWTEFVAGLDAIRSEIRSTKNLKDQVPTQELLFDKLFHLIDRAGSALPITPSVAEKVDPVDAPLPSPAVPIAVVERGAGEGRMLVMSRETPRISRPADLEEVFDEKELGK